MLWNVYLLDSECTRVNAEPYDAEQVSMLLESLDDVAMLILVRYDEGRGTKNAKGLELDQGPGCLGTGEARRQGPSVSGGRESGRALHEGSLP